MPYVRKEDRELLEPFIERLATVAADIIADELNKQKRKSKVFERLCMIVYFNSLAKAILRETALESAVQCGEERRLRYKLIAKQSAIIINIMSELQRRVMSSSPLPYNLEVALGSIGSPDLQEYGGDDSEELCVGLAIVVDGMVFAINEVADRHKDRDAFMGLDNYTLTELMPRIILKIYAKFQKPFDWNDILFLLQFWWAFYKDFYSSIAGPYEDEQIAKNGDVEIYGRMLGLLEVGKDGKDGHNT